MRHRIIGIVTTVAAAAATIAAMSAAPAALAYPGDPNPGCESGGFLNATLFCDGPIRPDGTWQRCWSWQANYTGGFDGNPGFYSPAGQMCAVISEENFQPAISPHYHIGD